MCECDARRWLTRNFDISMSLHETRFREETTIQNVSHAKMDELVSVGIIKITGHVGSWAANSSFVPAWLAQDDRQTTTFERLVASAINHRVEIPVFGAVFPL